MNINTLLAGVNNNTVYTETYQMAGYLKGEPQLAAFDNVRHSIEEQPIKVKK